MTKRKITTIGGGTGQFALLSALRDLPDIEITAVVSMADSGGSTGRLRDELGALPPGDVLKALLALSTLPGSTARELLLQRFGRGSLAGHNAGNMLLTILAQYSGSFLDAIQTLGDLLKITGTVLPVTVGSLTLRARLADSTVLVGETHIDRVGETARSPIEEVWLEPNALALPDVLRAIRGADVIMIGPGDLYTSLVPALLVRGVQDALRESRAQFVYLGNTMTKPGETDGFTLHRFVEEIERYAGRQIDTVIATHGEIPREIVERYRESGAEPVRPDVLTGTGSRTVILADLVAAGTLVRHDPTKLTRVLREILYVPTHS